MMLSGAAACRITLLSCCQNSLAHLAVYCTLFLAVLSAWRDISVGECLQSGGAGYYGCCFAGLLLSLSIRRFLFCLVKWGLLKKNLSWQHISELFVSHFPVYQAYVRVRDTNVRFVPWSWPCPAGSVLQSNGVSPWHPLFSLWLDLGVGHAESMVGAKPQQELPVRHTDSKFPKAGRWTLGRPSRTRCSLLRMFWMMLFWPT